jgi:hypothetical protein
MIDITTIKDRIAEMRKQRDYLTMNIYAVDGAIQDCEYWLKRLQESELVLQNEKPVSPVV